MVFSTTAAGTISQIARGFSSLVSRSCSEELPAAFSWTNSFTVFGDVSKTTHRWPPFKSRRTMFAPILPRPTIPSCINHSFADFAIRLFEVVSLTIRRWLAVDGTSFTASVSISWPLSFSFTGP